MERYVPTLLHALPFMHVCADATQVSVEDDAGPGTPRRSLRVKKRAATVRANGAQMCGRREFAEADWSNTESRSGERSHAALDP